MLEEATGMGLSHAGFTFGIWRLFFRLQLYFLLKIDKNVTLLVTIRDCIHRTQKNIDTIFNN